MIPQPDWNKIYREATPLFMLWLKYHHKHNDNVGPPSAITQAHIGVNTASCFSDYYIQDLNMVMRFLREKGATIRWRKEITDKFIQLNKQR